MEPDELVSLIYDLEPTIACSGGTVTLAFDGPGHAREFFEALNAAVVSVTADNEPEDDPEDDS